MWQYRNDYLLYSRTDDRNSARPDAFNPTRPFSDFTTGAHNADLVIVGTGVHYADGRQSASLFARSLNHTVTLLQRDRWLLHGHRPETLFVLSPPKPVVGCGKYTVPLSTLSESIESDFNEGAHTRQYAEMRRYHQISAWTAAAHSASFLDTMSLAARRPDATIAASMARAFRWDANETTRRVFAGTVWREVDASAAAVVPGNDCVHFCLPG